MSYTNTDRAESLTQPLAQFANQQGTSDEDSRTQLHDLLSNAAHFLDALGEGFDPADEFRRALETYEEERAEEGAEALERTGGEGLAVVHGTDPDGDALALVTFSRESRDEGADAVVAIFTVNEEYSAGVSRATARQIIAALTEALTR